MFRAAARSTIRTSSQSSLAPARTGSIAARRFLTTAPPHAKSRSFKNSALRWGIAVAGLYYYNTSPVFAEHPSNNLLNPNVDALDDGRENTTLDQLTASSRNKTKKDPSALQTAIEYTSEKDASSSQSTVMDTPEESPTGSVQELEQEAEGEGAFNPITGEINWDCPCLGGMAYGPCGEEFRTAFSCFVYSTEEPKGMDCVDKFQGMQDCFRAHPEHYAAELEGDDDAEASGELAQERQELEREVQERREQVEKIRQERAQKGASETAEAAPASTQEKTEESTAKGPKKTAKTNREKATPSNDSPQSEAKVTTGGYENEHEHSAASATVKTPHTQATDKDAAPESDTLVPKASHDAR